MSSPIIAFFNNKGGVGKTSLVYHLAWMYSDPGFRVVAVDLDPQANLTSAFLDEDKLEEIWEKEEKTNTIFRCIKPLIDGTGNITHPQLENIDDGLALIVGDLQLSGFEDELSSQWPDCLDRKQRAFRIISAFWRIIDNASQGLTHQFWRRTLRLGTAIAMGIIGLMGGKPSWAEQPLLENSLDLDPALIENSPTLQRWLEQTPDLFEDNQHDPAFLPTVRLGYRYFADPDQRSGLGLGVEDWFIGALPLSLSGDYQTDFRGQQSGGGHLQYYLLPLGWYVNVTPLVGYRSIQQDDYHSDGINVGGKVVFALSRTGAADLRLSQMFTAPGTGHEVGTSTLSVGYALSPHWRLATDLQQQNSPGGKDSRVGLYLEWQP